MTHENNTPKIETTNHLAEKETPWYKKKVVKIGAAVLAVTTTAAVAAGLMLPKGEVDNTDPNEGKTPVAEAPIDPSEPPVETAEPTPEQTEAPEVMPQNLEAYQQMPFEAFKQLPKSEQAIYVSWLVRGMDTFVSEWQDQKKGPTVGTYTDASLDSTGQEALDHGVWLRRMAVSLDQEDAKKVITFSVEIESGLKYDTLMSETDVPNRKPRAMAEAGMLPTLTVVGETEPAKDGRGVYSMELELLDTRTGASLNSAVYYHEFTGYDGQPFNVWL